MSQPDSVPLTFGQLSVRRIIAHWPHARWPETYLSTAVAVPDGCPPERVAAALSTLCRRHESLRTHFSDTPEGPVQRVRPAADRVEAVTVGLPAGASEPDAIATARGLANERIDLETDFGRRFTVLTRGGRPRYVVIVADHIVADGFAHRRLRAELTELMGGDDPQGREWLAQTPAQPAELALFQRSDANAARRQAALGRWAHLLETLPPEVFPVPEPAEEAPGRIEAQLRSPGARSALAAGAGRLGVPAHGVLLSLTSLAVAAVTGTAQVVLTLQSSNRFRPPWHELVSSMNQYAPLPLDTGAPPAGFGRYAESVQGAALQAYRTGSYDMDAVTELVRAERGIALGFDHFYNFAAHDASSAPGHTGAGPGRIEATRPHRQIGPRLDVKIRSGPEMPIVVRADPRLLPQPRLHALLAWYDEQLHRLAADGDLDMDAVVAGCRDAVGRQEVR
ncbi:condensation domain-containing protein [Streptomyces sp. IBSBF 2435]|uniref:condensation domain-containing protein n=1 Tax=Streptomyces sp. IBSBF 2435 TaxID=2903531 RepID=UPI002FDC4F60